MNRDGKRTSGNNGQQNRALTLTQQSAIDTLVSGKNDRQTAELLGLNRSTVTKWRLYDPIFQAEMNQRRIAIWSSGIDRLRTLIPQALDVLARVLETGFDAAKIKAAGEILRLAQFEADVSRAGPTDPDEIVRRVVAYRRASVRGPLDDMQEINPRLPDYAEQFAQVRDELEAVIADSLTPSPDSGTSQ